MIGWSEAAKYARSIFYSSFNDIDVFVEDTANESRKVYVELLNRVLGGKLSVAQVFPLGPKPTVIKRCAADQGPRSRKAVYIIDGDYDIAIGAPMPRLIRLYRLNAYCIENYLLDPFAIIDVLTDETVEHDEAQVARLMDLPGWIKRIAAPMARLLNVLVASHKCQCGLPSVKFDLNQIQGAYRDHVDSAKVDKLVATYEQSIERRVGAGGATALAPQVRPAGIPDDVYVTRYSSGKYVLMPLLRSRISRRFGHTIDYPKLRIKLARRCNVAELADLAKAVA